MKSYTDKNQKKSKRVADSFSNPQQSAGTAIQFADNRTAAVAQRQLAEEINTSPRQAAQRQQFKTLFDNAAQLQSMDEDELQMKTDSAVLQRTGPEEEELLQGKFETVQRQEGLEEEELLQGKFDEPPVQRERDAKPNNTGLPDNLKAGIENLSGYSMDDVSVHYNSPRPTQIQAHAYAQGADIHLASGQEKHLPHEAWHVVQQKQGRVKPTIQMKTGTPVNDDQQLEREADVMGGRANGVQRKAKDVTKSWSVPYYYSVKPTVQMKGKFNINDDAKLGKESDVVGGEAMQLRLRKGRETINSPFDKASIIQRIPITLPHPAKNEQWKIHSESVRPEHLISWVDENAKKVNIQALNLLKLSLERIAQPSQSEAFFLSYVTGQATEVQEYLDVIPALLFSAHQQIIHTSNDVLNLEQQRGEFKKRVPINDGIILGYLNKPDTYSVSTIANMKLQGALGHHVFIEYSDNTISEYAGPPTKAKWPKSQSDQRITTRAQTARLKMASKKHGFAGKMSRLWIDSPESMPRFEGYIYAPWYQDCFHWVDKVLSDAGEPPVTLVRITKGAVGKWAGVLAFVAGAAFFAKVLLSGK